MCIATKLAAYPWRLTAGQMVAACRWAGTLNPNLPLPLAALHTNFTIADSCQGDGTACWKWITFIVVPSSSPSLFLIPPSLFPSAYSPLPIPLPLPSPYSHSSLFPRSSFGAPPPSYPPPNSLPPSLPLRSSCQRLGLPRVALGQLHWSAANYAPLQERALWNGLVGMYEEVRGRGKRVRGQERAVGLSVNLDRRGME